MTEMSVDGPYYKCEAKSSVTCWSGASVHKPENVRWLKGAWRCRYCFARDFGDDVLHEWDTAMTLADYLAAPV